MTQTNKEVENLEYHSVEQFINSAMTSYPQLTSIKACGFVEYMRLQDMYYVLDERDFIPHLNHYLGLD